MVNLVELMRNKEDKLCVASTDELVPPSPSSAPYIGHSAGVSREMGWGFDEDGIRRGFNAYEEGESEDCGGSLSQCLIVLYRIPQELVDRAEAAASEKN